MAEFRINNFCPYKGIYQALFTFALNVRSREKHVVYVILIGVCFKYAINSTILNIFKTKLILSQRIIFDYAIDIIL